MLKRALKSCSFMMISSCSAIAMAQSMPVRPAIDENGVDLLDGTYSFEESLLSIGPEGRDGLSYQRELGDSGAISNFYGGISVDSSGYQVTLGKRTIYFDAYFASLGGTGETLTISGSSATFVDRDGTVVQFTYTSGRFVPVIMTFPTGQKLSYYYKSFSLVGSFSSTFLRLQSVTHSNGYQIHFEYNNNDTWGYDLNGWNQLSSATAINNSVEYCDPNAYTCPLSGNWQKYTFSEQFVGSNYVRSSTDPYGQTTRYTVVPENYGSSYTPPKIFIKTKSSSSDNIEITKGNNYGMQVSKVVVDGKTWLYNFTNNYYFDVATVTDPLLNQTVYHGQVFWRWIYEVIDSNGKITKYYQDSHDRPYQVVMPEGNIIEQTYDSRGNLAQRKYIAKPGSGIADRSEFYTFPSVCTNIKICNQAESYTDISGHVTNYEYDPTHGSVTKITRPDPGTGVRPETRFSYGADQAWIRDSGGSLVATGQSTYHLTGKSVCQLTAAPACVGTNDETKAVITYQSGSSSVGSNLLPIQSVSSSGTGSVSASIGYGWDQYGNRITVDGPLSGSADTTQTRYNLLRQVIGVVSPDPDGVGSLKHRATRYSYNGNGQVTNVETGTVNSQSDGDWTAMSVLQSLASTYNSAGEKVQDTVYAGGTPFAVQQYSYDAVGRPECSATRMNSATWSSLPSACTLSTTGSAGPDRIVKNSYDAAGQLTKFQSAIGTSDQADEVTYTYTNNGLVKTATDGELNKTSYDYDGFDRRIRTWFPSTTRGVNTPSGSDYEEITFYTGTNNVYSRRLRDGQMNYYSYDNLNRLTYRNRPNAAWWETDIAYSYDLQDRMTGAWDSNGHSISLGYDALGRKTSESSDWYGTMTSGYDVAGRRTSLTYPDGFYVNYDYLVTSEMSAVREYGATSGAGVLASYSYDDLGNRTGITRGNGTSTSYGYDAISRLSALSHDLAGSGYDTTYSFGYNPANQITNTTRSNDLYAWDGHYNVSRSYTTNGLNQFTAAGGVSLGYDGRGNITSSGSDSFTYTTDNQIATAPGSYYAHDPLGRLFYESTPNTAMLYDGSSLMLERDGSSGAIRQRYVYGAGTDEPIVWYDYTDPATRRWLYADERGSVVAVAPDSGTPLAINRYDEYGIPQAGNVGRFQYTGQMWLPQLGMYNYKARIYSPSLGRFMQTDPIGYGDGMNWHNYVKSDPINGSDPTGTDTGSHIPGSTGGYNVQSYSSSYDYSNSNTTFDGQEWVVTGPKITWSLDSFLQLDFVRNRLMDQFSQLATAATPQSNLRQLDNCGSEASFGTFRRAANAAFADNPYRPMYSIFPLSVIRGSRIHAQFAGTIQATGGLYSAEVSYKDGLVVPYGTSGSVRADGVYGPINAPSYVVELKSGFAVPTPSEIENYRKNLPAGTGVCGLVEAPGAG